MNLPRSLRYERFLIILIYTIEFLYALAVQYRFLIWILFGSYVYICVIYFPTPCNIFLTLLFILLLLSYRYKLIIVY